MARQISRSSTSSRTTTLLIALLSLTSNTLSSLFLHQLPDDPFHLAINYGLYLHFANVLSIFGVIGVLRRNPLSILLFSTYLLLDTILSSIPRILLLTLLSNSSSLLCTPDSIISLDLSTHSPNLSSSSYTLTSSIPPNSHIAGFSDFMSRTGVDDGWTEMGCRRIMSLGYMTLISGVVAAMGLQVLGALCVGDYARSLSLAEKDVDEEGVLDFEDEERRDEKTRMKMVARGV